MIKAVIFDMNGVIVDDEHYHQESWRLLCKRHNWNLSENEFKEHVFGRTEKDTLTFLLGRSPSEREVERYSDERVQVAIELFKPHLKLVDHLQQFLDELKTNNIKIGVATSSRRPYFNFIIDNLNLRDYLSAVETAEDVTNGKPDPEIYLKTAQRLEVEPSECVVFEDSISGIHAAKNAGMEVIAVATTHKPWELLDADNIVTSFQGVSLKNLKT